MWGIFCKDKYAYRLKNHGTHNAAVTELLPRTDDQYFSILSLRMSNRAPVGSTSDDGKVSQAGREYFYHAAKLQLRFRELTKLIEEQVVPSHRPQSIISWLISSPPKPFCSST